MRAPSSRLLDSDVSNARAEVGAGGEAGPASLGALLARRAGCAREVGAHANGSRATNTPKSVTRVANLVLRPVQKLLTSFLDGQQTPIVSTRRPAGLREGVPRRPTSFPWVTCAIPWNNRAADTGLGDGRAMNSQADRCNRVPIRRMTLKKHRGAVALRSARVALRGHFGVYGNPSTVGGREVKQAHGRNPAHPEQGAMRPATPNAAELLDSTFVDDTRTVDAFLRIGDSMATAISSRPARALLLRMDGVHAGSVFAVELLPCTIGRHPSNVLRIDEDSISRFHARISRDEQGFTVEDLDSRNGTFVGGHRVKQQRLKDGDGVTFGAQVAFRFNVTDSMQERLLRRLYESSTRDALTGAYNRAHFDERLRVELAFAVRHATETSLVMIDIDHFKRVNDTHGHQAGDLVLKEVVSTVQRSLRTEDVLARFGGEEFAVILRGTSLNGARRLGERLREAVEHARIEFDGRVIPVTLSAGCASMACCANPVGQEELLRIADRRLYLAKSSGRNRVMAEG